MKKLSGSTVKTGARILALMMAVTMLLSVPFTSFASEAVNSPAPDTSSSQSSDSDESTESSSGSEASQAPESTPPGGSTESASSSEASQAPESAPPSGSTESGPSSEASQTPESTPPGGSTESGPSSEAPEAPGTPGDPTDPDANLPGAPLPDDGSTVILPTPIVEPVENEPETFSATIGTSTLLEALDIDHSFKYTAYSEKSKVPVGETFNLKLFYGFPDGWPVYEYLPGEEHKPILDSVSNLEIVLTLPEGVEFLGDGVTFQYRQDQNTLTITDLSDIENGAQRGLDIPVRMLHNGAVKNGTAFDFTLSLTGNLNVITQWSKTAPLDIAYNAAALSRSQLIPVTGTGAEEWKVQKTADGSVGKLNDDQTKVSFTFTTAVGMPSAEGPLVSNPAEPGYYDKYGRQFFADNGFGIGETLTLRLKDDADGADWKPLSGVIPAAATVTYKKVSGDYPLVSELPGAQTIEQPAGVYYTGKYYNELIPNKNQHVGESPCYTAYTVTVEYLLSDLAKAAKDAGVFGECQFQVISSAALAYTLIDESKGENDDEAAQTYTMAPSGGTIAVYQNLYKDTNKKDYISYNSAAEKSYPASGDYGFSLYQGENPVLDGSGKPAAPVRTEVFGAYVYTFAGLNAGEYTVRQTGSITGHTAVLKADGKNEESALVADRQTKRVYFYASPLQKYTLRFYKAESHDGTNKFGSLSDVKFALYPARDASGNDTRATVEAVLRAHFDENQPIDTANTPWVISKAPSSQSGLVEFGGLYAGDYYIFECKSDKFIPNDTLYTAAIADSDVTGLTPVAPAGALVGRAENPILNTSSTGRLEVKKLFYTLSEDGFKSTTSAGTSFKLYHSSDKAAAIKTVSPNATTGLVTFEGLAPGEYYIQEAPGQWSNSGDWHVMVENTAIDADGFIGPFTVTNGKTTGANVVIHNLPQDGAAVIKKVDDTGKAMNNVEFQVRNSAGEEVKFAILGHGNFRLYVMSAHYTKDSLKTNGDGYLILTGLDPNETYTLTEKAAPNGYQPWKGTLTIKPKALTGTYENAAEYLGALAAQITALKTEADKLENRIVNVRIQNLEVTKKSSINGAPALPGAQFTVYSAPTSTKTYTPYQYDGKAVTATSGQNGLLTYSLGGAPAPANTALFTGNNDYYLLETAAPAGYELPTVQNTATSDRLQHADLDNDGKNEAVLFGPYTIGTKNQGVINSRSTRAAFVIQKTDVAGKVLPGAQFSVLHGTEYVSGEYAVAPYTGTRPSDGQTKAFVRRNATDTHIIPNTRPVFTTVANGATYVEIPSPEGLAAGETFTVEVEEFVAPGGYSLPADKSARIMKVTATVLGDKALAVPTPVPTLTNLRPFDLHIQKYRGTPGSQVKAEAGEAEFILYCMRPTQGGKEISWQHERSFKTQADGMAKTSGLNPYFRYALAEKNKEGVSLHTLQGPDGAALNSTLEIQGRAAYEITDIIRPALDNKTDKAVTFTLKAYNLSESGSLSLQKQGWDGTDKPVKIPDFALSAAEFDLYELPARGSDEDYLGADAQTLAGLTKLDPAPAKTVKNGVITFSGIKRTEQTPSRYLVVETVPPTGYLLIDEAYKDLSGGMNGNTRAVLTIDFEKGQTANAKPLPLLLNASESVLNLSDTDIALNVKFTAPESGETIVKPLQDLDDKGQTVRFEVINQSTLPSSEAPNPVPLYNYTLNNVGLSYYTDVGGGSASRQAAEYRMTEVAVPCAYYEMSGRKNLQGVLYDADTNEILYTGEAGKDFVFSVPDDKNVKNIRVLYKDPAKTGPKGEPFVGTHLTAPAITVTAVLDKRVTDEVIRSIKADATLSFDYYRDAALTKSVSKQAKDSDKILVPEPALFPTVTIAKEAAGPVRDEEKRNKVTYTLTAAAQGADMKKPVLIDTLPQQVDYLTGTYQYKVIDSEGAEATSKVTLEKFELASKVSEHNAKDQTYLLFYFDVLPKGHTLTLTFDAYENANSSTSEVGDNLNYQILNKVHLTTSEPLQKTTLNPTGQLFRDAFGKLPVVDDETKKLSGVWGANEALGYIGASAGISLSRESAIGIQKFVRGEIEFKNNQGFKDRSGLALTTSDGRVYYRVTVTNQTKGPISTLRLADVLPSTTGKAPRSASAWVPTLISVDENAPARVVESANGNAVKNIYAHSGSVSDAYDLAAQVKNSASAYDWAGWEALPNGQSATLITLDEGEKTVTAYPDVTAIALEFEKELPAGKSMTIEITMKAPSWDKEGLNEAANTIAYNTAEFRGQYADGFQASLTSDQVAVTTSPPLELGDYVWLDKNGDGKQDQGEPPISGVKVILTSWRDGTLIGTRETTTDENGLYGFNNLLTSTRNSPNDFVSDNTYQLQFVLPAADSGVAVTTQNAGGYTLDSDPACTTAATDVFRFVLSGGQVTAQYLTGAQTHKVTDYNDDSFDCGYVIKREISILKNDAANKPLAGAEFTLTGPDGKKLTATSTSQGKVLFTDLDFFTDYALTESRVPEGYAPLPEDHPLVTGISFPAGKLSSPLLLSDITAAAAAQQKADAPLPYKNQKYGELLIKKAQAGSDATVLAGVKFNLFETETGGEPIATITTGADGTAKYGPCLPGSVYYLEEFEAPAGYAPLEGRVRVTVSDGALTNNPTFIYNTRVATGKLSIHKVDKGDMTTALAGAVFSVLNPNGEEEARLTTDKDGNATSPNLPLLDKPYSLVELFAPEGYALLAEPVEVQIQDGQTVPVPIELTANAKAAYPATIGKQLSGAAAGAAPNDTFTFNLYAVHNGTADTSTVLASATLKAGEQGVTFKGTDAGSYSLTHGATYAIGETISYADPNAEAAQRYALVGITGAQKAPDGTYHFTVTTQNAQNLSFTATNEVRAGSLNITKRLLENKAPLAQDDAFTFSVYPTVLKDGVSYADTSLAIAQESVKVGETARFENLPVGRYAICETGMGVGYTFKWWGKGESQTIDSKLLLVDVFANSTVEYIAVNDVMDTTIGTAMIQKQIAGGTSYLDRGASFTFELYTANRQENGSVTVSPLAGRRQSVAPEETALFDALTPGLYAITELYRAGYTLESYTGGETAVIDGVSYVLFEVKHNDATPIRLIATNARRTTPGSSSDSSDPDDWTPGTRPNNDRPRSESAQGPLVTIEDEQVPLAQNPLLNIADEQVPLGGLPYTGGTSLGQLLIPLGALLALGGYLLSRRKKCY